VGPFPFPGNEPVKDDWPMANSRRTAAPVARASLVARLRAWRPEWPGGRFLLIGAALGAVAVIGLSLGLALVFRGSPAVVRERLVPRALARLDAGNLREARRLATQLRSLPQTTLEERGAAMYVLGSVVFREAQKIENASQQRILFLVASRYLQQANLHGFPPGREPDGLLVLGTALHHAGRFDESLPVLRDALEANPAAAGPLNRLLAEGYLQATPPQLDEALTCVYKHLDNAALTSHERHSGLLLKSRIQLARSDEPAAEAALAGIPPDSPLAAAAIMIRAQAVIQAARQAAKQAELDDALRQGLMGTLAALGQLESLPAVDREQLPPAQLLIGHAHDLLGDRQAALAHFDRLRRSRYGRPEGMAATLWMAELALREGRADEALEHYKRTLLQAGPREAYQNPWLSLADLEQRLVVAGRELIASGHHATAVDLAQAMPPVVPEIMALELRISAHHAWAEKLADQAAIQPAAQAEVSRAQARQHLRQAGADGQRLAQLRLATRHYVDDLAAAAEHYQRGQGFRQAVHVYREFLRQNPLERVPEALVGLGESLLALGETDKALTTLAQCRRDFATHPATYRARLLESQGWVEKGDLARAKELLLENLYRHALTPKSNDWRDSLYSLGRLLFREASELETKSRLGGIDQANESAKVEGLKLLEQSYATYQEAIRILTEAVQRYPAAAQAIEARYWIAESYRHAALWPRKKLTVTTIETSRLALSRQIQQELTGALAEYQTLIADLSSEQTLARRTRAELSMLRNCYFGRADALFDMGRYDDAIEAYSAATNRYQHDPESLEAYVQIATCYRRLKRSSEARGTLEQARVVLQRIRPDADFLRTTRLNREEWNDLLLWLRTL
jgi:tetratricopeptide (TPR) repeat protein